jgi:hypothetical protein
MSHIQGVAYVEVFRAQVAKEDIWVQEEKGNRRIKKTA